MASCGYYLPRNSCKSPRHSRRAGARVRGGGATDRGANTASTPVGGNGGQPVAVDRGRSQSDDGKCSSGSRSSSIEVGLLPPPPAGLARLAKEQLYRQQEELQRHVSSPIAPNVEKDGDRSPPPPTMLVDGTTSEGTRGGGRRSGRSSRLKEEMEEPEEQNATLLYQMLQQQIQDQQRELRILKWRRQEEQMKLTSESQKFSWLKVQRQKVCLGFSEWPAAAGAWTLPSFLPLGALAGSLS